MLEMKSPFEGGKESLEVLRGRFEGMYKETLQNHKYKLSLRVPRLRDEAISSL